MSELELDRWTVIVMQACGRCIIGDALIRRYGQKAVEAALTHVCGREVAIRRIAHWPEHAKSADGYVWIAEAVGASDGASQYR